MLNYQFIYSKDFTNHI